MQPSSLRSFLQDPAQFSPSQDPVDQQIWLRGLEIAIERSPNPFLPAQQNAWKEITHFRLALLLGPPGTGKTFVLSWMILGYMVACMEYNQLRERSEKKTCRVLVSAFTKTAIENVLRDISEKLDVFPELEDVNIAFQEKTERLSSRVLQKGKKEMFSFLDDDFFILAATSWTFLKGLEKGWIPNSNFHAEVFDFVCFDEASQMRLRTSVISMSLAKEQARILFVGDNKQLPPVGEDFEWAHQDIAMGSSAYDFIHHMFQKAGIKEIALQDTFRLNPMLASLPSTFLYHGKYNSTVKKENFAIQLHDDWKTETEIWKQLVLHPDHSIAVILLDAPAAGKINLPEVDLVEELTVLFRKYIPKKENLSDDLEELKNFWSDQFGIISPHRLQNIEIKKRLESRAREYNLHGMVAWSDTVEKMQGQSRDCVLISMTVSDIEFAMQEGGFLFDKRRFNVAITRARNKVILIMSPTLLKSLSNDNDVNEGITFLMEFIFQCREKWNGKIFGHDATIYTQSISEFIEKSSDSIKIVPNNIDTIIDVLDDTWMEISKVGDKITPQNVLDWFDKGYIDVRIISNASWEIRKRKAPSLPFPIHMLRSQHQNILPADTLPMDYFDFLNYFKWFDEQGVNHLSPPLKTLMNEGHIQITSDKAMISGTT